MVKLGFAGEVGRHEAIDLFTVIGMQAVEEPLHIGPERSGLVSQHRAEPVVYLDAASLNIPVPSPYVRPSDNCRQLIARFAYLLLSLFAFRQILDERKEPGHSAILTVRNISDLHIALPHSPVRHEVFERDQLTRQCGLDSGAKSLIGLLSYNLFQVFPFDVFTWMTKPALIAFVVETIALVFIDIRYQHRQ